MAQFEQKVFLRFPAGTSEQADAIGRLLDGMDLGGAEFSLECVEGDGDEFEAVGFASITASSRSQAEEICAGFSDTVYVHLVNGTSVPASVGAERDDLDGDEDDYDPDGDEQ